MPPRSKDQPPPLVRQSIGSSGLQATVIPAGTPNLTSSPLPRSSRAPLPKRGSTSLQPITSSSSTNTTTTNTITSGVISATRIIPTDCPALLQVADSFTSPRGNAEGRESAGSDKVAAGHTVHRKSQPSATVDHSGGNAELTEREAKVATTKKRRVSTRGEKGIAILGGGESASIELRTASSSSPSPREKGESMAVGGGHRESPRRSGCSPPRSSGTGQCGGSREKKASTSPPRRSPPSPRAMDSVDVVTFGTGKHNRPHASPPRRTPRVPSPSPDSAPPSASKPSAGAGAAAAVLYARRGGSAENASRLPSQLRAITTAVEPHVASPLSMAKSGSNQPRPTLTDPVTNVSVVVRGGGNSPGKDASVARRRGLTSPAAGPSPSASIAKGVPSPPKEASIVGDGVESDSASLLSHGKQSHVTLGELTENAITASSAGLSSPSAATVSTHHGGCAGGMGGTGSGIPPSAPSYVTVGTIGGWDGRGGGGGEFRQVDSILISGSVGSANHNIGNSSNNNNGSSGGGQRVKALTLGGVTNLASEVVLSGFAGGPGSLGAASQQQQQHQHHATSARTGQSVGTGSGGRGTSLLPPVLGIGSAGGMGWEGSANTFSVGSSTGGTTPTLQSPSHAGRRKRGNSGGKDTRTSFANGVGGGVLQSSNSSAPMTARLLPPEARSVDSGRSICSNGRSDSAVTLHHRGRTLHLNMERKVPIGRGSYGKVFKVMDSETNGLFAVKEIMLGSRSLSPSPSRKAIEVEEESKDGDLLAPSSGKPSTYGGGSSKELGLQENDSSQYQLRIDERQLEVAQRELEVLQQLHHDNIIEYIGYQREKECLRIFMEYASEGSVTTSMKQFGPFQERQAALLTRQMLCALTYLHSKGIYHCDLKGDNLLLAPGGKLKLADFGTARNRRGALQQQQQQPPDTTNNGGGATAAGRGAQQMASGGGGGSGASSSYKEAVAGTAYFMSPEMASKRVTENCAASDIWSAACCVVELLTGKPPLAHLTNQYTVILHLASTPEEELQKQFIPPPERLSAEGRDFLTRCLQFDPAKRPTAKDLLDHPWVRQDCRLSARIEDNDSAHKHEDDREEEEEGMDDNIDALGAPSTFRSTSTTAAGYGYPFLSAGPSLMAVDRASVGDSSFASSRRGGASSETTTTTTTTTGATVSGTGSGGRAAKRERRRHRQQQAGARSSSTPSAHSNASGRASVSAVAEEPVTMEYAGDVILCTPHDERRDPSSSSVTFPSPRRTTSAGAGASAAASAAAESTSGSGARKTSPRRSDKRRSPALSSALAPRRPSSRGKDSVRSTSRASPGAGSSALSGGTPCPDEPFPSFTQWSNGEGLHPVTNTVQQHHLHRRPMASPREDPRAPPQATFLPQLPAISITTTSSTNTLLPSLDSARGKGHRGSTTKASTTLSGTSSSPSAAAAAVAAAGGGGGGSGGRGLSAYSHHDYGFSFRQTDRGEELTTPRPARLQSLGKAASSSGRGGQPPPLGISPVPGEHLPRLLSEAESLKKSYSMLMTDDEEDQ